MIRPSAKEQLHERNRFRAGYNFARLIAASPRLEPFVLPGLGLLQPPHLRQVLLVHTHPSDSSARTDAGHWL